LKNLKVKLGTVMRIQNSANLKKYKTINFDKTIHYNEIEEITFKS